MGRNIRLLWKMITFGDESIFPSRVFHCDWFPVGARVRIESTYSSMTKKNWFKYKVHVDNLQDLDVETKLTARSIRIHSLSLLEPIVCSILKVYCPVTI